MTITYSSIIIMNYNDVKLINAGSRDQSSALQPDWTNGKLSAGGGGREDEEGKGKGDTEGNGDGEGD